MLNQFSPHRHNPYFSRDHHPRQIPPSRCQPARESFHPDPRVVGVKTNRSGEISSIRYTSEEERPYFEGIRAAKVRFIPPKAAPKHALNAFETPPKRRKTIVDIDEDVRRLDRVIIDLKSSVNSLTRQLSNHNTVILGLRQDLASANKKIKELERR